MDILALIADMRQTPDKYVVPVDPIAVGAFLHGYMAANPELWPAYHRLLDRVPGPDSADASTRTYLLERDDRRATALLLSRLEEVLQSDENAVPDDIGRFDAWAPTVVEGIRQGRQGMYLGESTVMWLFNYVQGFHAGLRASNPSAAQAQENELKQFEQWLQSHFRTPSAPWYKILRVFGGADAKGLQTFVRMWDAWKTSTRSESAR